MSTRVPVLWAIKIALVVVTTSALLVALLLHKDTPRTVSAPVQAQMALSSPQDAQGDLQDRILLHGLRASRSRPTQAPRPLRVSTPASPKHTILKKIPTRRAEVLNLSGTWARLAQCEASGDWHEHGGNGFYGGLQFTVSTWREFGGTAFAWRADYASPSQQIVIAKKVLASQGWGAWPACSRKLGLR